MKPIITDIKQKINEAPDAVSLAILIKESDFNVTRSQTASIAELMSSVAITRPIATIQNSHSTVEI